RIITRAVISPITLNLDLGAEAPASVAEVRLDRQIGSPSTEAASVASKSWLGSGIVAKVTPTTGTNVTITGMGPGQVSLFVRLTSTSLSNARLGTLTQLVGDSVRVTVN